MRNAMPKYVVKGTLLAAVVLALGVMVAAYVKIGPEKPGTWAAAAGALAVLTATISSWSTLRMVEMEEQRLKPSLRLVFDLESRYMMAQLALTNKGGSPAYDVRVDWEVAPFEGLPGDEHGGPLHGGETIPVIVPDETIRDDVGSASGLFQKHMDATFHATVTYKDASTRTQKFETVVSAEQYRQTLTYTTESPKTHYRLQQLPDKIDRLTQAVQSLKKGQRADRGM
jgi:hypothetical protein